MNGLLEPLSELNSFNELCEAVAKKKTPVLATGVIDSQKTHLCWGLLQKLRTNAMIVTESELKAREVYDDLRYFSSENVKYFPSKDIIFYSADVHSMEISHRRLETIYALLNGEKPTIVLSVEALFDRLTDKEIFRSHIVTCSVGDCISPDDLSRRLVYMGYERAEHVEGPGQFALRGGILDMVPVAGGDAVRIEFWDDEVDSIRLLDVKSQRSVEKLTEITVCPIRELVYDEECLAHAIARIEKDYDKCLWDYTQKGLQEEAGHLRETTEKLLETLRGGGHFVGGDRYIQYFYDDNITLLDYMDKDTVIFFDEPNRIAQHSENVLYEFHESIKNRILKGYMLPGQMDMVYSYAEILHKCQMNPQVLLATMVHSLKDFKVKEIINFSVKSSGVLKNQIELLFDDLHFMTANKYKVVILAGGRTRGMRFTQEMESAGIPCAYVASLADHSLTPGIVTVSDGGLSKGFEYAHINLAVITDKEIFGEEKKRKYNKKARKGNRIESFLDLKPGDYIVHDSHGIGVYRGIEKIITDNISRDYLKLSYADGGNLYVPVSQMDSVQKYVGGENTKPKLNKLGGVDWSRAKAKARSAVKILASELVELYARRQAQTGFSYTGDTVWQREFEETFPFNETDDQMVAIEEVKRDMESSRVMDRLLCGDVGYGKTEVAIRAAFKAVQDSKQVAYLVPTTILAQQHYNTFTQRMKDFPIGIEMLSRFRTPKQQKESMSRLANGLSDIVIGTHRILSKDVRFRDLGLVIIDEEQRFGVAHKEKLKHLRANVDVLTLTATPIPRTLHMSLTGIRDMSVLEEPPLERHPVQTYVMENDSQFVRDAILRELARNGQVYYLHNRVMNIDETAKRVQELVPEAVVTYAHGQMSERELENIMKDFIDGEINVLVCTTIIETGLDIANVNTIIIQDADRMGLSQLYQLRGRVGRSNRIAYAYLMYKKDKVLQEVAEKRLQAIREFTEFGSGFKIAMRDLEIRGAGNLLGAEQHGHMDSVGYDLYCRMLDEAVRELRGEAVAVEFETCIDIQINAHIPAFYIGDEEQKLEIYKKISVIRSEKDFFACQEELEDRFGDIPSSVQNLLDVAMLKSVAHNKGISGITQKNSGIILAFAEQADLSGLKVEELLVSNKNKFYYTSHPSPYITYRLSANETTLNPRVLQSYLEML